MKCFLIPAWCSFPGLSLLHLKSFQATPCSLSEEILVVFQLIIFPTTCHNQRHRHHHHHRHHHQNRYPPISCCGSCRLVVVVIVIVIVFVVAIVVVVVVVVFAVVIVVLVVVVMIVVVVRSHCRSRRCSHRCCCCCCCRRRSSSNSSRHRSRSCSHCRSRRCRPVVIIIIIITVQFIIFPGRHLTSSWRRCSISCRSSSERRREPPPIGRPSSLWHLIYHHRLTGRGMVNHLLACPVLGLTPTTCYQHWRRAGRRLESRQRLHHQQQQHWI